MFCKKCPGKIHKIGNNLVICIRPVVCKLEAIACFASSSLSVPALFLYMGISCGIAVILSISPVGNDKNLYILKYTGRRPKAVSLISVYLIKRF